MKETEMYLCLFLLDAKLSRNSANRQGNFSLPVAIFREMIYNIKRFVFLAEEKKKKNGSISIPPFGADDGNRTRVFSLGS